MTVSCPDCRSVFRVDPAKVPATGVRARCSVCGGVIVVSGGTGPMRTPMRTPVLAVRSFPSAPPVVPPAVTAVPAPSMAATRAPVVGSGTMSSPLGAVTPRMATPTAAPGRIARMTPPVAVTVPTPVRVPPVAPTTVAAPSMVSTTAAPMPLTPAPVVSPSVAPAPGGAAPAGTPRRAINPFLNADPGQRARRLARALVSDLVAYHPRKRAEGLAQGTLRQLFRDEIKKSYEEYVEQVGKELAESTPHFQEALNDILAGGQRLF
jgi:predicted Zn finger-like uncharacterized protein